MYNNSDHAGTPEGVDPSSGRTFKSFVVGGARPRWIELDRILERHRRRTGLPRFADSRIDRDGRTPTSAPPRFTPAIAPLRTY
jgi:hypothetical protein